MPVYDEKYINAKVRAFNGAIKKNFFGNKIPKAGMHYTCINSVMRVEKRNYLQVYLEECKHKRKKRKMTKFVEAELESESESELESDTELELKSDTE